MEHPGKGENNKVVDIRKYFKTKKHHPGLESNIERVEILVDLLEKESERILEETKRLRNQIFRISERFETY